MNRECLGARGALVLVVFRYVAVSLGAAGHAAEGDRANIG